MVVGFAILVCSDLPCCEAFSNRVRKKFNFIQATECRISYQTLPYSRTNHHQALHHGCSNKSIRRIGNLYQMNGFHEHNGDSKSNDQAATSEKSQQSIMKNASSCTPTPTEQNELEQNRLHKSTIPRHVAFVCDGNSRWAKARNVPTFLGHAAGADRLVEILTSLKNDGVPYCTMYGFSTENWKRSKQEVDDILTVMEQTAHRFYDRAIQERVRVKILGDMEDERLPQSLRDILAQLERDTMKFGVPTTIPTEPGTHLSQQQQPLTLCLAINYGGRTDIVKASLRLAQALSSGEIDPEDVSEETFSSFLCTNDIPDPDLIIRTSGECRLSNFLLWNAAYAELHFTPVLWPDFGEENWKQALDWYGARKRRFGAREETQRQTIGATSAAP